MLLFCQLKGNTGDEPGYILRVGTSEEEEEMKNNITVSRRRECTQPSSVRIEEVYVSRSWKEGRRVRVGEE